MATSTQPPADIVDFANRYYLALNRLIANRMRLVGVPDEMIGFQYPGIDGGAFVRYPSSQIGGNLNPHLYPGRKPGINVDYGVLDADHPAMASVPSWRSASWRERIDAVIAHEYTEALASPMTGLDFHLQALMFAPDTLLHITPGARQILREYRTVLALD